MENLILFLFPALLSHSRLAQPKPKVTWHPNRYYMELSPLFGVNKYYQKKFDEYLSDHNTLSPSGVAVAFVVGGTAISLNAGCLPIPVATGRFPGWARPCFLAWSGTGSIVFSI